MPETLPHQTPWLEGSGPNRDRPPFFVRRGPREDDDPDGRPANYRLVHLGDAGVPDDALPGRDGSIDDDYVGDGGHVLVLGESGSGITDLLRWWRYWQSKDGRPLLEVDVAYPAPRWTVLPPNRSTPSEAHQEVAEAVGEFIVQTRTRDNYAAYRRLIDALGAAPGITVAFESIGALDAQLEPFGEGLRAAIERPDIQARFLFVSQADGELSDTMSSSGVRHLSESWRMPSMQADEIVCLARGTESHPGPLAEAELDDATESAFARAVLEQTGGQPVLVQTLLNHLAARGFSDPYRPPRVHQAARAVYASPPPVHKRWQHELEAILRRDWAQGYGSGRGELLRRLRAYSSGDRVAADIRISQAERPLYLGGWLAVDPDGCWGFRSLFHREFAQPVMDRVAP